MFCNLIFFPIHIYNLQYNTLAKKELYEHFFQKTYLDGSGVFRSRGLFGLARDERWIRQKTEDFGILDLIWTDFFFSKTFGILFGFGWVLQEEETAWRRENILGSAVRFSKPNSQTDTQCASSQLGLSQSAYFRHFLGIFVQKIISDESQF